MPVFRLFSEAKQKFVLAKSINTLIAYEAACKTESCFELSKTLVLEVLGNWQVIIGTEKVLIR